MSKKQNSHPARWEFFIPTISFRHIVQAGVVIFWSLRVDNFDPGLGAFLGVGRCLLLQMRVLAQKKQETQL